MVSGKNCFPQREAEQLDLVEDSTARVANNTKAKGIPQAGAKDVQQQKAHFLICTGSARAQSGLGHWSRKKTPHKAK